MSGSYTVASGVTSIGDWALADTHLSSVTVPSSVTYVGWAVFGWCVNLTSITVQATTPPATAQGWNVLVGCPAGLRIHVPSGTLSVYQAATGWSDYASQIVSP